MCVCACVCACVCVCDIHYILTCLKLIREAT